MRIDFSNNAYIRSHGRSPRGRGYWAFDFTVRMPNGETRKETWFAQGDLKLTEAKKQARAHALYIAEHVDSASAYIEVAP